MLDLLFRFLSNMMDLKNSMISNKENWNMISLINQIVLKNMLIYNDYNDYTDHPNPTTPTKHNTPSGQTLSTLQLQ